LKEKKNESILWQNQTIGHGEGVKTLTVTGGEQGEETLPSREHTSQTQDPVDRILACLEAIQAPEGERQETLKLLLRVFRGEITSTEFWDAVFRTSRSISNSQGFDDLVCRLLNLPEETKAGMANQLESKK
jgi:hypothetical protein